ncbi:ATP-dependent DNA helicase [Brevibacillus brevis]|uniref:ATP-dependent DNA helicase n=1 Tax=Brevibacillus brevis TaxID=1393 RepID=UPI001EDA17FB|nr:ATP-dependent RecD-like DNA helicase [Brevibacillus brevis]
MKIDSDILVISRSICNNIARFAATERGLLSQNILSQLRNFVESIAVKIYGSGNDIDLTYNSITKALEHIKTKGSYRFLSKFHELLQISASHYTLDEGKSERLMLKYYEYLLKIKVFLKNTYNLDVLDNIDAFPLDTDSNLSEYYEKIAARINQSQSSKTRSSYNDRYYIQKVKPIFVNHYIYYEVTFTVANDKASKFDRVIAFTKLEISHNYAVKLSVRNETIDIMGKIMPIQIIDGWEVSIRPCELNRFAQIVGERRINGGSTEYRELMRFLTETGMSLVDLIDSSDDYFLYVKNQIFRSVTDFRFFDALEKSRELTLGNRPGSNVIRYLLHKLNNKVLKQQHWNQPCKNLSYLHLSYGCIPFDEMPFNTSLRNHNPKILDLFECIKPSGREHELLARLIKNNTERNGVLFTPKKDIEGFDNIDALLQKYNNALYYKHAHRRLENYKDHIYINGYAEDSVEIIRKLREISSSGINNYLNSVEFWLQSSAYNIDCDEKKSALKQMFVNSRVALIYGSAGTGKSTLINHVSNFFNDRKKIYLANTNPAVDNLRRKVTAANCSFKTIRKFLSTKHTDATCDLLIIDECSTVSNTDMKEILEKASYKLLILVGDIHQIESIVFGNWFSIAKSFISAKSVFELTKPYRTTNLGLLNVWNRVRNIDMAILEPLVKNNYSVALDESIFDNSEEDQIILCLNYDGLYGINNINRFLQGNNTSPSIQWGINTYKVNDPILFNESERFAPLIYNNLKGKITAIDVYEDKIQFEIEIDKVINELDAENYDFQFIGTSQSGNSIIRFFVNKFRSTDEEDDDLTSEAVIPFQVAYAVSIHKAQGLEYNSVKIVITNEIEELITHNIFYTSITRAKENLKIYWTPETEHIVLSSLELKNGKKDVALLTSKFSL